MRALGHTLARRVRHTTTASTSARTYEAIVGNIRTPLRVLIGAVLLVLLIACANVAEPAARVGAGAAPRAGDPAGARRRPLGSRAPADVRSPASSRSLAAHSACCSRPGRCRTFVALAANVSCRAPATIRIDGRVLAFTAIVSLAGGDLLRPVAAARMLRRSELADAVREGDTRTGSGGGRRFGNGLVVAEIAVAFALLVGAGLLVKNLVLLRATRRRHPDVST